MRRDISGWDILFDETEAARYYASGAWRGRTIVDDARERAVATPDKVCLREGERTVTYLQALMRAEALAAQLWARGLRPGQVVSFQLPNWIEAAVINLAATLIGLVVNPIVPIYRDKEVEDILADSGASVLFIPEHWRKFDYRAMAERIRTRLPKLGHVVLVRSDTPASAPAQETMQAATLRYEDLLNAPHAEVPWPAQRSDAVKFVLYTSGTTGRAKGVLHTHDTIARTLTGCMEFWNITNDDVIVMASPVTHITGYLWGLEAPFSWGNLAVLMERWVADEAVEIIDRYGVAMTVSATPFLVELLEAARKKNTRLPSLKIFGCGGASVPPDLIDRANAYFAAGRAFRVYGATEVPMIGRGCVDPDDLAMPARTDGKICDFDVLFVDDQGHKVADGVEGEILARGAPRCVGYVNREETARSFDARGFFHTGDLGYRTSNGAVVISGRKKDLIIRGGENISAKEIEDLLVQHPAVHEVAAVSMPHKRLGETVCVYVAANPGHAPALADLVSFLEKAGLARQKFPERLELIDDFPRTPAGKIKKDILRAMIAKLVEAEAS